MYTEIGSFNAKAKLSELLQGVKRGERYTITLRGKAIADLVPSGSSVLGHDVHLAIKAMRNIRKIRGVSAETVEKWISEGRE